MATKLNFKGNFTPYSLRITAVSILANQDIPDFRIQGRSGHISVAMVQKYKRESNFNIREDSEVLFGNKKRRTEQSVVLIQPTAGEFEPKTDGMPKIVNFGTIQTLNVTVINKN